MPDDYYFVTDFPRQEFKDLKMSLIEAGFSSKKHNIRVHYI